LAAGLDRGIQRPWLPVGPVVLVERVAAAREAAKAETYERVEHLLTPERCGELDRLLVVDPELGHTRLFWLADGATQGSPTAVKAEVAKLAFLRGLDADTMDLSAIPAERRRFLAGIGRRSTAQTLVRREGERRYPILLAVLAQTAVEVLDESLTRPVRSWLNRRRGRGGGRGVKAPTW
jgi:hypothetical protein